MWRWRVTAALAAVILCALIAVAGPGSIEILGSGHAGAVPAAEAGAPWARRCLGRSPEPEHSQLAFCARVRGRVIYSDVASGSGETHLLVLGSFHLILVELPLGAHAPGLGSRITAVGPLLRAS